MQARVMQRALTTNATTTSFPSKVMTTTMPSGDGVLRLAQSLGQCVPKKVLVIPFGTGDANDVFDARLIGWRRIGTGEAPGTLWVPTILAGLTCTLGASTGVAGAPIVATELIADTITVTAGGEPTQTADVTATGSFTIFSPQNDLIAWAVVPLYGVELLEFTFDMTTGNPTGANFAIAFQG